MAGYDGTSLCVSPKPPQDCTGMRQLCVENRPACGGCSDEVFCKCFLDKECSTYMYM